MEKNSQRVRLRRPPLEYDEVRRAAATVANKIYSDSGVGLGWEMDIGTCSFDPYTTAVEGYRQGRRGGGGGGYGGGLEGGAGFKGGRKMKAGEKRLPECRRPSWWSGWWRTRWPAWSGGNPWTRWQAWWQGN